MSLASRRLQKAKDRAALRQFRRTKGFMSPARRARRQQFLGKALKAGTAIASTALGGPAGAVLGGLAKNIGRRTLEAGMTGGLGAAKKTLTDSVDKNVSSYGQKAATNLMKTYLK